MARFALGKQTGNKVVFDSLVNIARAFVVDLSSKFPNANMDAFPSDWLESDPPAPEPATKHDAPLGLYEVDAAGKTTDPLAIIRQHGFDIGSAVGIQKATDVWTITGIDGKKIQLAAGDARTAVEVAAFVKTWSLKDPKSVEEVHPAWPESRVIQTKVAQTMIVKGQILAAVGHLASAVDLNFKHPACLTVYSKPVRAVKMNSNVPVGGLVLSPDSVNVKVTSDLSSFDASAAVRVTVEPNPLPDQYYFLAAATATDLMSPLWCAQTTTEEGDANMTWSKYEVSSRSRGPITSAARTPPSCRASPSSRGSPRCPPATSSSRASAPSSRFRC